MLPSEMVVVPIVFGMPTAVVLVKMWFRHKERMAQLGAPLGLHQPEGWPGLEVGWALARAYWGLGYATEAARVSVEHAFANLDHDRVISLIAPENARSIRVAERLGARATGSWRHRGRDLQVYAIDRARWTAGMRNEDGGIRRGRGAGRGDLRGAAGVPPPSGYRSTSDG